MSASPKPKAPDQRAAAAASQGPGGPREISVDELLGAADSIVIRHGTERYTLRLTRQNRLLLTK